MDTKISFRNNFPYLEKIQHNNIIFNDVWLFGSVAKRNKHEEMISS
jgi:hypothetical protein